MNAIPAKVTQGGRLVLPSAVRKEMSIHDGDVVMLEVRDNLLQLVPLRNRLDAVQAACSKILAGAVDELIQDRRAEAQRESER